MPNPFEEIAGLTRLIHEPARLAILTALSSAEKADFLFLENLTGLTKGNLSTHLSKLEEGRLIEISKQFVGKKPVTLVSLTTTGQAAIEQYWQQLENLRERSRVWSKQHSS